jgi:hypothetical protein
MRLNYEPGLPTAVCVCVCVCVCVSMCSSFSSTFIIQPIVFSLNKKKEHSSACGLQLMVYGTVCGLKLLVYAALKLRDITSLVGSKNGDDHKRVC